MDTLSRQERSQRMSLVRSKDTKPEKRVRHLVYALGYRYRLHYKHLPGCPDLVFPSRRAAIFVHGCFWHQHWCDMGNRMPKSRLSFWRPKLEGNKKRDANFCRQLRRVGWRVLVIWECQTIGGGLDKLGHRIIRFLGPAATPSAMQD
jgi:DNA mismatch endonuclease (patch repair protein)